MKILNLNNKRRTCLLMLLFLSISSFQIFLFSRSDFSSKNSFPTNDPNENLNVWEQKKVSKESQGMEFKTVNKIKSWNDLILKFDKDKNGITDILDTKLNSFQSNKIPIIIQFPQETNVSLARSIFKTEGGEIKFTYKHAIKGFSGTIDYTGINKFCKQLRDNDIDFLMEEDHKATTHLYYTSRSMNLRPYVWKDLASGYDGDDSSSIAILDTGIDDSQEFFDNYSFGDFTYKIVGWRDFTIGGSNDTVNDEIGHGSHCAGIAAGMGTPILDGDGRTISTETTFYNFTGWDISAGGALGFPLFTFNAPSTGEIEIECNFTDYTPLQSTDRTQGWAWLFRGDSLVADLSPTSINWEANLTYTVTSGNKGVYELWALFYMDDKDGDNWVSDSSARFRAEVHWPFTPSTYGCGNYWRGVAPDTHLVGVKVIPGGTGEIVKAIDWIISNRTELNITVISMSIGLVDGWGDPVSDSAVINAVNHAVEKGIVTVVSAGNDGAGSNQMGSPADADKVITVAAMNNKDQVAEYSSQGGSVGNTTKPDIMAPGGSIDALQIFSADTNDNDGEKYPIDNYLNDLKPAQGTSMACPAVAGAANLLIEAMGGGNKWNWNDGSMSKLVKALLLMTATETYPLKREGDSANSPTLDRGGKDVHEGYGRINVDAAIEAWTLNWTTNITNAELLSANLKSSKDDPYGKHAKAGFVELEQGKSYIFNLHVPSGADYDLYVYNGTYDPYGEPVLLNSSISPVTGKDEILNFTAPYTGKYFVVIKAIGKTTPPVDEGDDDDGGSEEEVTSILEFFLSPLGLFIIGISIALVIIIIILAKRSGKGHIKEKEKIRQLMDESYY